jgi:glycosyltransferase involved in cell wall biosynthesis
VVPLGLELERFTVALPRGGLRQTRVPSATPLVGIVGRLVPIKDVPTFLEAAARVRARRPDCRFAVVGDGEERGALEKRAHELGLDEAVTFHGWQPDMTAVYGDLDVVVNCSRNEGTPVALIEALAAARPVVATRVGGTPDLLGDDERGRLVPPSDPEALARSIVETLDNPEEARGRALAGRRYVLERHSSARLVGDIDALYRELLAAKEVAA